MLKQIETNALFHIVHKKKYNGRTPLCEDTTDLLDAYYGLFNEELDQTTLTDALDQNTNKRKPIPQELRFKCLLALLSRTTNIEERTQIQADFIEVMRNPFTIPIVLPVPLSELRQVPQAQQDELTKEELTEYRFTRKLNAYGTPLFGSPKAKTHRGAFQFAEDFLQKYTAITGRIMCMETLEAYTMETKNNGHKEVPDHVHKAILETITAVVDKTAYNRIEERLDKARTTIHQKKHPASKRKKMGYRKYDDPLELLTTLRVQAHRILQTNKIQPQQIKHHIKKEGCLPTVISKDLGLHLAWLSILRVNFKKTVVYKNHINALLAASYGLLIQKDQNDSSTVKKIKGCEILPEPFRSTGPLNLAATIIRNLEFTPRI